MQASWKYKAAIALDRVGALLRVAVLLNLLLFFRRGVFTSLSERIAGLKMVRTPRTCVHVHVYVWICVQCVRFAPVSAHVVVLFTFWLCTTTSSVVVDCPSR